MCADVSAVLEDYLEAIAELGGTACAARSRDIAARVRVHKSTVTAALHSLSEKGLVHYAPYAAVSLTEAGREVAGQVCRRHRVLRRFLGEILGMDAAGADATACRLEHAVDPECLERLLRLGEFLESSAEWRAWSGRAAGGEGA
jgi:DtxR family Mn-dependent transcriptional regulator